MAFGGGHGGFWYLKLFFQVVFRSVIQIFMSNAGQYFKTLDLEQSLEIFSLVKNKVLKSFQGLLSLCNRRGLVGSTD